MLDGRFLLLLFIISVFWLLAIWEHRKTFPFGQIHVGKWTARFVGGHHGYVNSNALASQIGFSAMLIVDTLLRALNITDNFGVSVAVTGIVIVISQQLLKRKAER